MKWFRPNSLRRSILAFALGILLLFLLNACATRQAATTPSIEFTVIPPAAEGGPDKVAPIAGRVVGARPGQKVVLFAKAGIWWVQPTRDEPFTNIQPDSTWTTSTHLGTEYAALLVEPGYRPPTKIDVLPAEGGDVVAVKTVPGEKSAQASPRTIQFSGYEWQVRSVRSTRGGRNNNYDTHNAWTDANGFLHLRIAQNAGEWSCAEVKLLRSLGYGTYRFVVRDVSQLEPSVVLSLFTWDEADAGQSHREMNIELARWGDAASKNAQYVVQPYYVPANVVRFNVPAGVLTHSFRWEPGRVAFKTVRGPGEDGPSPIAQHVFTSGVPSPGGESIHLDLYLFGNAKDPLRDDVEVVIEKFEYLP
ncbi:MAG TPA: hypothetical protein VJM50_11785 [Pyrinomonadaceae bacterium]|nr:hypothetical protein [Pyrinomonadaceae bacterium]